MEFNPKEKNCIVSDEDTFSRADQQGQVVGKDYYEPICVAGKYKSLIVRIRVKRRLQPTCHLPLAVSKLLSNVSLDRLLRVKLSLLHKVSPSLTAFLFASRYTLCA